MKSNAVLAPIYSHKDRQKRPDRFRLSDWWNYLVPFLLGLGYFAIYYFHVPFYKGVLTLLLFIITISATAAFGYFLNDVTDRNDDKLAGKRNVTEKLPGIKIIAVFIVLAVFAIVPWLFLPRSKTNIMLYGAQIMLLIIYSAPPLRLKRFPIIAVVLDAAYNSVIPLLIIASTFMLLTAEEAKSGLLLCPLGVSWALLKGLRGIMLHQVTDRKNDRKTGIKTFANKFGPMWAINLINRCFLRIETFLLISILIYLSVSHFPFLWIIVPLFLLYVFFFFRLWERMDKRKREQKFNFLYILNDLYEEWLPLVFLIYLVVYNPWYITVLFIHIVLFYRTFQKFRKNGKIIRLNFIDYRRFRKFKKMQTA